MPIDRVAATGFARSAEAYERGRPGYPDGAVDWLAERLGDGIVVDLAAGTGKLSRSLADRGLQVVAVEPVAEMRAVVARDERLTVLDGTAEAIGLGNASAGAVTVAQAFHWFDGPRALAEIARVLRPGGVLAIVFNRRRMEDEIHRRIQALLEPSRGETPAHASDAWRPALDASQAFGQLDRAAFDHAQSLDGDGLVDRFASVSFVACMDARPRAVLQRAIRELAGGASVTLRYRTEVDLFRTT